MKERNVTHDDLATALVTATHAAAETGRRFRLSGGADLAGAPLVVVVAIDAACVVITLF